MILQYTTVQNILLSKKVLRNKFSYVCMCAHAYPIPFGAGCVPCYLIAAPILRIHVTRDETVFLTSGVSSYDTLKDEMIVRSGNSGGPRPTVLLILIVVTRTSSLRTLTRRERE